MLNPMYSQVRPVKIDHADDSDDSGDDDDDHDHEEEIVKKSSKNRKIVTQVRKVPKEVVISLHSGPLPLPLPPSPPFGY